MERVQENYLEERRLSAQVKQVNSAHNDNQSEKPYSTWEVKRRSGTGVGLPSGTGMREKEQGPRVKVYRSSVYKVNPKGKRQECDMHIKKVQPSR